MRGGWLAGEASVELIHEFAYVRSRRRIARVDAVESARDVAGICPLHTVGADDIERALDLWCEHERLDMRDAIFAAQALNRGIDAILSPDRGFDGIHGLERIDPADVTAVDSLGAR
jgi:predicted nucleic acid-binding protein